jgi:diacylglycerol kinase (ATP)
METHVLFVCNPKSELLEKTDLESIFTKYATVYNYSWKVYYSQGKNDDENIRKLLNDFNPSKVVVVGGDGTINMVSSLLIKTPVELGIIPAGSANGLAFNLGIPPNIEDALKLIFETKTVPIDVLQINNRICLHLSDIGINARIVKRFDNLNLKGLRGYGKQMIKELKSKKTIFGFTLITPGLTKRYRAEMLIFTNARSFGTGAVISPHAQMDDGLFDIVIIRPYPYWALIYLFMMSFIGKTDRLKYVKIIPAINCKVILDRKNDIQIDGEVVEGVKNLEIKIIKSAIKTFALKRSDDTKIIN